MASETERKKLWVPYLVLLVVSVIILYYYPIELISALRSPAGQGAFAPGTSVQVNYFTIAGAILSFVLVTYFVLKQDKSRGSLALVALLVAYVATISVTVWYELLYAGVYDAVFRTDFWNAYYSVGSPPRYGWVLIDVLLILVAYPWMRRENAKPVLGLVSLTLLLFAGWILVGFGKPEMSLVDYFFNGSSRITSDLALALAVRPGKNTPPTWVIV